MSNPHPAYWGVVPAAGVGKRMGADLPKQYLQIIGKPVLQHTLERLLSVTELSAVVVALGREDGYWPDLPFGEHPRILTAEGGKERADSVLSALDRLHGLAAADDWVLVHDAARLCITRADVRKLIETLRHDPVGGILALPSSDTLKGVENGLIVDTVDRNHVWRALTPQMFRYQALRSALREAAELGLTVTDEASALELKGETPRIVEGRPDNIKITRPEDLPLAAFYLEQQCYE
ncbi:2-C-methyl-D-erythritol 4-phosphate cytidylyltransferase [Methylococcus sp. EFPC2]|uniref:2-C-methyl-D-erythritol 4-phosphate cytidylyltransferase n=1 Tax=Methylococcus sp. EFPC2 TaxID=2812648 RepID=UPI0019671529|nr:2-C-methyl-D-erythritol 4-phosphate cytidylyltransferase [Methylococcus sp. EFPC2]QSA95870.1 2-C-methyl-D-erythritol 4-phosphate cytidylyltransferase [Methylococcus sp. EFPC2]